MTPADIIRDVSALQNDVAQTFYNNASVLPYLNIAMQELQDMMEEANIPITNETSIQLTVPAGANRIAFEGTIPVLPIGLVEIQQLWESDISQESFIPMTRKEFIPHNEGGVNYLGIWAWINNEIRIIPTIQPVLIKMDYIKTMFTLPILISQVDIELGQKFRTVHSYLGWATAALCSMFIGENETRAGVQQAKAVESLERSLNIPNKGKQMIMTRRRPFRAGWKFRGVR